MDFFTLLQNRRSIRDFEQKEVPLQLVKDIIKDACMAPSASNRQPWGFVVIRDMELMQKISDASKRGLLNKIRMVPDHPMKPYELHLQDQAFNLFYNAPCLVFITGPADLESLEIDCALAASYFMLSAAARGLGSCWIGLGAHVKEPDLLKQLSLPRGHEIVAPIILGYPKNIPAPLERVKPRIKVVS